MWKLLPDHMLSELLLDRHQPKCDVVGTNEKGLFQSMDSGMSWIPLPLMIDGFVSSEKNDLK